MARFWCQSSRQRLASSKPSIQAPLDGVTVDVGNADVLRAETLRSKRFGFGGKLCIHPQQVDAVNLIFSPTAQELEWAAAVIDAVARSGGAAVAIEGKMVDRPVILKAERILLSGQHNDRPRI